jgi:hypothetical protein
MSAAVPVMEQTTILLMYFHDAILYYHARIFTIEGVTLKHLYVFVENLMIKTMAV